MAHAEWNQSVCDKTELSLCIPLWQRPRLDIVHEFIRLGFQSIIVTVNLNLGMKIEDLGQALSLKYIDALVARGIDPCGEWPNFQTSTFSR